MTADVAEVTRWWPRWADLPAALFTPGWVAFTLRTWIAASLALAIAFWSQIDAPAGAAVTVMILAQPLRGQALSKAFYRLLGTAIGMTAAILLVAAFPQDRPLFLGAAAIWMAACAFIGSLERDFRSYGALLAGYTVALVALSSINQPDQIFDTAFSRAACIGIGVASVAIVNVLSNAPEAWRSLARIMAHLADRVRGIGEAALRGEAGPDAWDTTALAAQVLSLMTQISYAWMEIDRAATRLGGARLGIIGMLEVLTCTRGLAAARRSGPVSPIVLAQVQKWIAHPAPQIAREDILTTLMQAIDAEAPGFSPTAHDAYFLERAAALISNTAHIDAGMRALLDGTPAGEARLLPAIGRETDFFTALINACRVLFGFSLAALLCIWLGQPGAQLTLVQTSLTLVLAATAADTRVFGKGALIGIPAAVGLATMLHFFILPRIDGMIMLTAILLPVVALACLLLLHPRTGAIGFNFAVFLPVILGIGNPHSYEPLDFVSRDVFYLLSALLTFIILVLLLPTDAHGRRLHMAIAVGQDLNRQRTGRGAPVGPELIGRKYDRLATTLFWSQRLPAGGIVRRQVFDRLVRLEDCATTLARLRHVLNAARSHPPLAAEATRALATLGQTPLDRMSPTMTQHAEAFLALARTSVRGDRIRALTCAAGSQAVAEALSGNANTLRHYGLAHGWRAV